MTQRDSAIPPIPLHPDPASVAARLRALAGDGRLEALRALAGPDTGEGLPDDAAIAGLLEAGLLREVEVPGAEGGAVKVVRPDVTAICAVADALQAVADRVAWAEAASEGADAGSLRGPRLLLVRGVPSGRTFVLDAGGEAERVFVLGRGADVDVRIGGDPFASVRHAAFVRTGGETALLDLGSRNGTTLNGTRLDPDRGVALRPGDLVGIGRTLLLYRE